VIALEGRSLALRRERVDLRAKVVGVSATVEHEILFIDGQVSQVAFDMGVRLAVETPGRVDRFVAYDPIALAPHTGPERTLQPGALSADDLAALHALLWSPVTRAAFFADGSALIESDAWRLRVESSSKFDPWSYEGHDGLTIHSSAGELSYNRPYPD
jgi:hypothetical protein